MAGDDEETIGLADAVLTWRQEISELDESYLRQTAAQERSAALDQLALDYAWAQGQAAATRALAGQQDSALAAQRAAQAVADSLWRSAGATATANFLGIQYGANVAGAGALSAAVGASPNAAGGEDAAARVLAATRLDSLFNTTGAGSGRGMYLGLSAAVESAESDYWSQSLTSYAALQTSAEDAAENYALSVAFATYDRGVAQAEADYDYVYDMAGAQRIYVDAASGAEHVYTETVATVTRDQAIGELSSSAANDARTQASTDRETAKRDAARGFRVSAALADGGWSITYAASDLGYATSVGQAYLTQVQVSASDRHAFLDEESATQKTRHLDTAELDADYAGDEARSRSDAAAADAVNTSGLTAGEIARRQQQAAQADAEADLTETNSQSKSARESAEAGADASQEEASAAAKEDQTESQAQSAINAALANAWANLAKAYNSNSASGDDLPEVPSAPKFKDLPQAGGGEVFTVGLGYGNYAGASVSGIWGWGYVNGSNYGQMTAGAAGTPMTGSAVPSGMEYTPGWGIAMSQTVPGTNTGAYQRWTGPNAQGSLDDSGRMHGNHLREQLLRGYGGVNDAWWMLSPLDLLAQWGSSSSANIYLADQQFNTTGAATPTSSSPPPASSFGGPDSLRDFFGELSSGTVTAENNTPPPPDPATGNDQVNDLALNGTHNFPDTGLPNYMAPGEGEAAAQGANTPLPAPAGDGFVHPAVAGNDDETDWSGDGLAAFPNGKTSIYKNAGAGLNRGLERFDRYFDEARMLQFLEEADEQVYKHWINKATELQWVDTNGFFTAKVDMQMVRDGLAETLTLRLDYRADELEVAQSIIKAVRDGEGAIVADFRPKAQEYLPPTSDRYMDALQRNNIVTAWRQGAREGMVLARMYVEALASLTLVGDIVVLAYKITDKDERQDLGWTDFLGPVLGLINALPAEDLVNKAGAFVFKAGDDLIEYDKAFLKAFRSLDDASRASYAHRLMNAKTAAESAEIVAEIEKKVNLKALTAKSSELFTILNKTCFAAGTPLLTPDGERMIETLRPGDLVLSRPEDNPTAAARPRAVERVFKLQGPTVDLHVGGRVIRTTAEHPFYVVGQGWKPTGALVSGDQLLGHDGATATVERVESTGQIETVYNIRVADFHTYFVGSRSWEFDVWAHNAYHIVREADAIWKVTDKDGAVVFTGKSYKEVNLWAKARKVEGIKDADFDGILTKALGPHPEEAGKWHAHHIVMKLGRLDSPEIRDAIEKSQAILEKYRINWYDSAENLTWATYRGHHTKDYTQEVLKRLTEADNQGGRPAVIKKLREMGEKLTAGKFWEP